MGNLLGALLEVLLVNLVLSGDNAVVIGLAARGLPAEARKRAILAGGGLAVLLRVLLTLPAEFLLQIAYLRAAGGILLLWVAYRLLVAGNEDAAMGDAASVATAIKLIVLADLTMSLDNILAVAAVAERSSHAFIVLVIGIALSIPIVLAGGGLVARLMNRLPVLVWIGAAILAFTAGELILDDVAVDRWLDLSRLADVGLQIGLAAALLAIAAVRLRLNEELTPQPTDRL